MPIMHVTPDPAKIAKSNVDTAKLRQALKGLDQLEFEDHNKSHIAWLVRFMAGILHSRNPDLYKALQQGFPTETLRMAFELRQLYKQMDPNDTEVFEWETRIMEHLAARSPEGEPNGQS